MGRGLLAGDQAGELEQYPGQSRSGDRYGGCRGVGRGGRDRHPAHLRWLPRRTCPGGSANRLPRHTDPASPDRRRDLLKGSCGRPGQADRPRIGRGQAFSGLHSAHSARVATSPTVAVALVLGFALALALALEIALEFAFTFALEIALAVAVEISLSLSLSLEIAVALAVVVILVIPVADGLRPDDLSWAAAWDHRADIRTPPAAGLVLCGGLVPG